MNITAEVIASMVGGKIEGEGTTEITGFAKIEEAKTGDLSFIANPKYAHFGSSTSASALLVAEDFPTPERREPITLIRVKDPYSTLALLMRQMARKDHKSGIEQPCYISDDVDLADDVYVGAFSYIGKGAKIGKNVKIYPQVFVGENVVIGDNTIIYPHVSIYEKCEIGADCILHSGCVIGADGFGFAPSEDGYDKIPQLGIVRICNCVEVGANTTIDRATMGETVVGKGTKLDNLIQVAHNVRLGSHNVVASQAGFAGSTTVGDWNRIGGQAGFNGHIHFGNRCEVGAQSGIHRPFKDGARVIGYPAVDVIDFAKLQVYLRRLPELFADVNQIKKEKNKQ